MPSASDIEYHGKSVAHQFFDASAWFSAEAGQAAELARAAFALGRLEGAVAALEPEARAGANRRLALIEVEAMLWAQGTPLRREEIGRDLMEARAGADLEAMRLARWGIRRLEGQGDARDLRGFDRVAKLSTIWAAGISALLTLSMFAIGGAAIDFLSLDAEVREMARLYLVWAALLTVL